MRKVLLSVFILSIFVVSWAFFVYAGDEARRENVQNPTGEKKRAEAKKKKRRWEFSTAASLDISRASYDDYSDTTTTISIPLRIGFFISNSIEIEPEINYMYERYGRHAYDSKALLLANVAFHPGISARILPFVLGGAGIIRISENYWYYRNYEETKLALNAGAGLKWFVVQKVALRCEYRFIYYSLYSTNYTHHKIFLGIS
ncbi:MAG: outer membrane protein, partial [Candidatus Aminicenantales bacterium]